MNEAEAINNLTIRNPKSERKAFRLFNSESSFWNIYCYDKVGSTMNVAREHYQDISAERSLMIVAKSQKEGKGRQGKTWEESEQGLYATYVFKIDQEVNNLGAFSLVAGLSVHRVLSNYSPNFFVKWPNDILSKDGKKISGILIENWTIDKIKCLSVGIGVNLSGKVLGVGNATSLFEQSGRKITPIRMAGHIGHELRNNWSIFKSSGFETFIELWDKNTHSKNSILSAKYENRNVIGEYKGVNIDGSLNLYLNNEIKIIRTPI